MKINVSTFYLAEHRLIQLEIPKWLSTITSKLKVHFESAETNDRLEEGRTDQKWFEISHSTSPLQTVYIKVLAEPDPSRILAEHRNIQSKIPKRLSKTTSKEKI